MPLEFVPDRPIDELIARAKSDVKAVNVRHAASRAGLKSALRALAGETADLLMTDIATVRQALRSPASKLRLAAAYVAFHHWNIEADGAFRSAFSETCLEMAFHDLDPAVRGMALRGLFWVYKDFQDPTGALRSILDQITDPADLAVARKFATNSILQRAENAKELLLARTRQQWEKTAGDELNQIMLSAESALWYTMNHESDDIRRVAIQVLLVEFPLTPAAAGACEGILRNARDTNLRCGAINVLSQFYDKKDDRSIEKLLAEIAINDAEDIEVRRFAYDSLFRIHGVPVLCWPSPAESAEFPKGANWAFVKMFLAG